MVVETSMLSPQGNDQTPQMMWVIFSDETDLWFLKPLRDGFRHCFILMQQDNRWVLIDPRSDKTEIEILPHPHHFNFPRFFMEQGKTVVKVPTIHTPRKIASILPVSCVEIIKRFVGLHQWWVVTPYQLYRSLLKIQKKGV